MAQPKRIFIAATMQNDGKTTVSMGLITALKKRFRKVGFIKPIGQRYLIEQGYKVDEDSVLIESGSLIIDADAQGTLILPTDTFENVLRIHLVESFHIKAYMMGTPVTDNVVEDDYYYWFHDDILH